ncbi:HD domain-containing protein [Candidatus Parcubacteria bacterium]|jgi:hypothetical protein|nr:HD domain-containing protein [Candidatus Parcubacteria bacterium]
MQFKKFQDKLIPNDIELLVPDNSPSNILIYIPWHEKYLEYVQPEFKDFFLKALPKLHARTTDVHTAISLSYLDKIIDLHQDKANRQVVALGLILHDIGWASLSEQEIIDSLSDYKGLVLSETTKGPKERHAIEGVKVSGKLLNDFDFEPPLSAEDKQEILDAVKYHDEPEQGTVNAQLVADLDRLWSFTHENFWQDTIRKDVTPEQYLANLTKDSETYFSTKAGLIIAKELLQDRAKEVEQSK